MKETYCKAMDWVYSACIWIAGLAMVVMTVVIPIQVVARKCSTPVCPGRNQPRWSA